MLSIILCLALIPCEAEQISTAELCQALVEQREALEGKKVAFTFVNYRGDGASSPPEGGPGPEHFLLSRSCSVVRSGRKFRTEEVATAGREDMKDMFGIKTIRTRDEVQTRSLDIPAEGQHPSAMAIRSEPSVAFVVEHYMTWLGFWIFQNLDEDSFIDLLKRDGVEGPDLLGDGRTRWQLNYFPNAALVILIADRLNGRVQLVEAELRQYYSGKATPDARDIQSSGKFVFGPIRWDRGEALASTCDLTACYWRPGHPAESLPSDFWGTSRITLESIESVEITPELFRPAPGPKATILDTRYRIAYDQGTRFITVDGRILETHEPVFGDKVGEELEQWVKKGRWLETYDPVTGEPQSVPAQTQPESKPGELPKESNGG